MEPLETDLHQQIIQSIVLLWSCGSRYALATGPEELRRVRAATTVERENQRAVDCLGNSHREASIGAAI